MTDLPPPPTQTYTIDSTWRMCGYTLQYNSGYVENEVMMRYFKRTQYYCEGAK